MSAAGARSSTPPKWRRTASATSSCATAAPSAPSPSFSTSASPIEAGQGAGSRLLSSALDWLYIETETNRIDLDLFVENERARHAYEKLGFIVEGRLRDYHRSVDSRIRDALIMSILRKDWAKRHRL